MMAFKIQRPDTAFANAPARGVKRKRVTDEQHLRWLRALPCVISGKRPVEAAHIRFSDPAYGKRETGMAEKPDDRWALPLSPMLHREQHAGSERLFWAKYGIDPCKVAAALYGVSGDDEQVERKDEALSKISKGGTAYANATVRRLCAIARSALGDQP